MVTISVFGVRNVPLRWGRVATGVLLLSFALSILELLVQRWVAPLIDARLFVGITIYCFFVGIGFAIGNVLPWFLSVRVIDESDASFESVFTKLPHKDDRTNLLVIDSDELLAFSVQGWKAPVTVLSRQLISSLSIPALRGVLAHEKQHAELNHLRRIVVLMAFIISAKFTLDVPSILIPLIILAVLWTLRRWEFEADYHGAVHGSQSDMLAALSEMRALEPQSWTSRLPEFLMAFPSWPNRIERLRLSLSADQNRV